MYLFGCFLVVDYGIVFLFISNFFKRYICWIKEFMFDDDFFCDVI